MKHIPVFGLLGNRTVTLALESGRLLMLHYSAKLVAKIQNCCSLFYAATIHSLRQCLITNMDTPHRPVLQSNFVKRRYACLTRQRNHQASPLSRLFGLIMY
jgi:hypothetical protein